MAGKTEKRRREIVALEYELAEVKERYDESMTWARSLERERDQARATIAEQQQVIVALKQRNEQLRTVIRHAEQFARVAADANNLVRKIQRSPAMTSGIVEAGG